MGMEFIMKRTKALYSQMKIKYIIFLLLIVFCAFFLRFYQLGKNPPSLTWDEVAWGYNAYALGTDGRDEFGRFLPLNYLESFGDFKPPMYAYLAIVPVKLFGLNEFATRFPSAFFGTLTVLFTYFLTIEIFKTSENKKWYALVAASILAISPWHIMLSRAAFEANVATFFLTIGVWLYLKAVHDNLWYLCCSVASFVFAFYTFNSARIVGPLLIIFLSCLFWKTLWNHKKQFGIAVCVGIIMLLPTLKFLTTPQAKLRFQEVNIFSDPQIVKTSNQEIANDNNALWSKVIHNRRWLYALSFTRHYFDNLNPNFLFIRGDGNPKFSTQDVGEMYIWDIIFFVCGILFLFKKKEGNWIIIPLWLLIGIIPAATARETPHALRIEATLPTFQICIAYGFVVLTAYFAKRWSPLFTKIIGLCVGIFLLGNVFYFLHGYYTFYPSEFSGEWQYGYKDSITYIRSVYSSYDHFVITETLGRPYIYYLFYLKYNPQQFRNTAQVHRDVFGFVDVQSFDKYQFSSEVKPNEKKGKTLFIDTPNAIPGNAHIIKEFNLLNGEPALVAYTI